MSAPLETSFEHCFGHGTQPPEKFRWYLTLGSLDQEHENPRRKNGVALEMQYIGPELACAMSTFRHCCGTLTIGVGQERGSSQMDKFIAQLNIKHLRELLAKETDETKQQALQRLLADEEEKLKAADARVHEQKNKTS
jgi:hypothetical protein